MAINPQDLMTSFVWGAGGKRKTPEQIDSDKKLALLLMKSGTDSSPVQHWTQGGARVMQALAGVVRENRANNAATQNASLSAQNIAAMLSGNQQPQGPSVVPAPQPQTAQQPNPNSSAAFVPPAQPQPSPFTKPEGSVRPDQPFTPTGDPVAPVANNSASLNLDPQSVGQIKKTLLTEVIAGLPKDAYNAQAAGIVDTIMNRVVSGRWGDSVKSVVNAPYQFSDINGPVSWKRHGRNNVDQITDAWLATPQGQKASQFVDAYLAKRSGNAAPAIPGTNEQGSSHFGQLVGGHLNYANPHYSDASNLGWINKLDGPRLGVGKAIHHHGTAGNQRPVDPNYAVNLTGQQPPQAAAPQPVPQANAQTPPIFLGDSHASALARFGNGQSMGVNGANIAQSVAQLQNAPAGSTVFMSAGTNDAVGNFNPDAIRQQVARAAEIAKARGINLNWVGPTGPRSEAMDRLLAETTAQHGIQYRSTRGMNVAMQPDGIHAQINPNGYGAMWNAINAQPQPDLPQQPFQVASLGPTEAPQASPVMSPEAAPQMMPPQAEQPQPEQVAQAPFSMNDAMAGNSMLPPIAQQQPRPIMPPQAAPQAQPQPAPQAPQAPARPQIDPRIIQSLTSPYASPQERSIAMELIKPHITPSQQQFSTMPNGMVLRKDPRSGRAEVVNPYNGQVVTDPSQIPQGLRNTKYGLNVIHAEGPNGEITPFQLSDDNKVGQVQLPPGFKFTPKTRQLDLGTHFQTVDPLGRPVGPQLSKDIAGAEKQKVVGKGEGQNIVNQPKNDAKRYQAEQNAKLVIQDIDRALDLVKTSALPTTGFFGNILKGVGNTGAHDISKLVDTIKSHAGFDRLQAMRDASPTGGALGQVAVPELVMLQSAIGSLEQSQSQQQFVTNLERVKEIYLRIIHGPQGAPQQQQNQATPPNTAAPRVRRYNPATGELE